MPEPTKDQIQLIFKKLKQNRYNKACFDCNSKNPNWASIPFGVYICTECSSAHRNLGVHISFVRSTVLDSWTWEQLRMMKVGGNQAASEFFSKNSINSSKDTRAKYSSRVGQQYKELLAKRTTVDGTENPTTVVIDFNEGAETVEPIQQQEEAPAQVQTPVKEEAPQAIVEEEVKKPEEPKPTPKVATPTARAVKTTMGARPRKAGKTAKLGIKKAPVNFNFEAAEAKAKEDQERKAKLGYDEEEEKEEGESKEDAKKQDGNTPIKLSTRLMYQDPQQQQSKNEQEEEEYEKLGFGMSRLNMNKKPSMPDQKPYQEQSTSARDKFGSARAISSDQYFGRNDYDPAVSAAQSSRLSQFSSAKAISSDQYFGRESEYDQHEDMVARDNTANDWDNVQDQAVAIARKFVDQASADLDAVKDLAENATRSVRSYFA
ncbi:ArfGap-domain-containing protein, partial [Backusella circina FSU 941]